ncbi:MAG: rubrerythrin family protein [Alistipes sp.]|nr:rubrerythrin family protein [Alistipes sp.]
MSSGLTPYSLAISHSVLPICTQDTIIDGLCTGVYSAGVTSYTISEQEKEHAKRFFKYLEGGDVEITATYPAGKIGTTAENLVAAAAGEHEEWDVLYAEFARVADEEGFADIAETFRQIAKVEAEHERRYLTLLERVSNGTVFVRDNEIWWQCRNCGYTMLAKEAPIKCPACAHPQSFFEPKKENY